MRPWSQYTFAGTMRAPSADDQRHGAPRFSMRGQRRLSATEFLTVVNLAALNSRDRMKPSQLTAFRAGITLSLRQIDRLVVKALIKCGVRPGLICLGHDGGR
jgi:hypothetical protein